MVDGRLKGNRNENTVARELSVWVSPDLERHKFRTCPVSSLVFRRKPAANDNVVTDWVGGWDVIHSPRYAFPFCVEAKAVEGWSFDELLTARRGPLAKWWEQTKHQSAGKNLWPMLIFTAKRKPDYVMVERDQGAMLSFNLISRLHDVAVTPLAQLVAVSAAATARVLQEPFGLLEP